MGSVASRSAVVDAAEISKSSDFPKRPVLILGFIPRIIVPVARSLHRHGVPVDVVRFPSTPKVSSRAIRENRTVPWPDVDRAGFVEQLRRFIGERGHDMVIPADDGMLTALSEHYDDFADLLHIGCPPRDVTRLALDKTATLEIAQRCGIQVPRTVVVSSSSQLRDLVGNFPFPWILKPAKKEIHEEEVKSFKLTTPRELAVMFPSARELTPPLLVQEYCAGAGVGIELLMHDGECIAVFQHRRIKELPYTGGYSVIAVADEPDRILIQNSVTLLRAMRWQGVAMVEYKVNPEGRAVLMEVNGRYWGTIALPISAGMDFPLYHWQLAHGEQPETLKTYLVGKKWRWTTGYLERLFGLAAKARSSEGARQVLLRDLRQLLTDFGPSVSDSTLRLSDPMPSLSSFFYTIWRLASYTVKRLV
jgi:predicted ATP-grasp superfamily ATP-dependent carboligase